MSTGPATAVADVPLSVTIAADGELASGSYTVAWRTMATDGHPSHGTFVFSIATAVTNATGPTTSSRTEVAAQPSRGVAADAGDVMPKGMVVESPIYIAIRWLSFVALLVTIGTVAFRVLVLPRATSSSSHPHVFDRVLPRLASLGFAAGATLVIATIGRLYAQRAVMASIMNLSVGEIVSRTDWGHAWLVQLGAAVVVCIGFALAHDRMRAGWVIAGVSALILGVTPSLSGHAIAAPELRWLAVTADSLHVIAAGGWLGSLFALTVVGVPLALTVSAADNVSPAPLVANLVNAFSPTALLFASLVVASGVISAWLRLGSLPALWHTRYGVVLLIKLALVALVFAGGAFNWLRVRGSLGTSREDALAASAVERFRQSGRLELVAGMLVIVATAILVATPTPT